MTDNELTQLVQRISKNSFGKEFNNIAKFNNRLRSTGGRFHLKDGHIDINPKVLERYDEKTLEGIIKHELVHYHLYYSGGKHYHSSPAFKALLKQVGGSRYAPELTPKKRKTYKIYQCKKCGLEYKRIKKINTWRFVCGKCRGRLVFIKESIE
ncbi:protein SprT [Companilactobacillus sp. RD055328]|uniref:SprT family protein n=1 Tax=Companilactobacillus sp. RD055328 TaxID=2916634 RepID=UPI001FC843D6|nr:SprT family protein [Companilactobacillus sp. RD055328]GKQ43145.1 protein SprT [Companilactobacillus sp. RD055328]